MPDRHTTKKRAIRHEKRAQRPAMRRPDEKPHREKPNRGCATINTVCVRDKLSTAGGCLIGGGGVAGTCQSYYACRATSCG